MEEQVRKIVLMSAMVIGVLSFFFLLTDAAMSYSDNPKFCITCHSMDDAYQTYKQSNHKQFTCSDCHAPHSFFPKAVFKTKSGLRDLYATTLGEVPEVIKITDESKNIIQENCIGCHYSTVEKTGMGQGRFCTDCHRGLPHDRSSIK